MKIILNNSSMVPIYEQLVQQIKDQIIDGQLISGKILPSVRTLSSQLKISALTVKKAYDKLEEDGFIVTVHGKGSFVAEISSNLTVEAYKKAVEDDFAKVIQKARNLNITNEEIKELVTILLEDNL